LLSLVAASHVSLLFLFFCVAGRGGTGDTWAFLDTRTGKQVAIKFIKRPLPKLLLQNITREFTVRIFIFSNYFWIVVKRCLPSFHGV
jgi:hypothetical protein